MTKVKLIVGVVMAALLAAGGFLIIFSTAFTTNGLVIEASKTQQFNYGLGLLLIGIAGLAFLGWFYAVNGRNSIFRRQPRPWGPSPST